MSTQSGTAVILAAGEGRRLEPLTNRRPKPMLPVGNRPLLEYVVKAVAATEIDRVVIVVGYRAERIRTHFGDGDDWGVAIEYVEQTNQLGTGHAILQAEAAISDPFVVLNGDRIVEPELIDRVRQRVHDGETPAIAVTAVENPRKYGVVSLAGNRVTAIDEKPEHPVETAVINAGVYGFSTDIFAAIRRTEPVGELAITATLNECAADERITAIRYSGTWLDVSQLWDLLTVNAAVLNGGVSTVDHAVPTNDNHRAETDHPTADMRTGGATVARDALVDPTATLGSHATIGGATAIGSNVSVGANAVVERSIIFPDAAIAPGAVVRDAVIAANARLGPNTTVDGGASSVVVDTEIHRGVTLGGVVGDNTTIGGAATLTDAAIVGDDATVAAGVVIDGRIESGAVVRRL